MRFGSVRVLLIAACLLAFPVTSPAPLVYRPGEGWVYEPYGADTTWQRARAKEQLEVAQAAFDQKAYGLALRAARRTLLLWPLADYAPQAQYLVARCYQATGKTEKAFKEYQTLLEKQPKFPNFEEVRQRQYEIADLYLAGKYFKYWGYIPYRSMERTAGLYADIVKTGPYSEVAPEAQLKIGTAWEKQKALGFRAPDYSSAIEAYERAADRYYDQPKIAAEALFRAGLAYHKQARSPDRDQSSAGHAIAKLTEFSTLYPDDPRVPQAQNIITSLRREQARGSFAIAQFYEKRHKWVGARIYYNEVLLQDPNSPYAAEARQRIDQLNRRIQNAGK